MRKLLILVILALILTAGLVSQDQLVSAQTPSPTQQGPQQDSVGNSIQPDSVSPDALTLFTISNPYCYQPDPSVNSCNVNFRYIQANDNQSSAPYMTWLAITISSKNRFTATAFFEGTIYVTYDMIPGGMKVPCGLPNAGGAGTQFGNVYGVVVQPLDSSRNPMSTDIANVTCPAFAP
jgi:hypothetical protein